MENGNDSMNVNLNLYDMLDDLERLINEGKKVPLTNQYVINRDNAVEMIQRIRDSLPEAVVQADQVLAQEAQIISEANSHFGNIIAEAESKARALSLDSKQRAEKIINDAQDDADHTMSDAQQQANQMIADAKRRAEEMVSKSTIMAEADREATRLLTEADREASRITQEARTQSQRDRETALGICENMLKDIEDTAIDIANQVRAQRMNFERER